MSGSDKKGQGGRGRGSSERSGDRGRSGGRGGEGRGPSGDRGRSGGRGGEGRGPSGDRGGEGRVGTGRGTGGGGRGKNRHMGEVETIQRLLHAPGMLSEDIQRVIAPSARDRNRSRMIEESNLAKPALAEWRLQSPIGATLPTSDVVRANFFQVNTDGVPSALFKYAVHIYSINPDGSDKEEVSQREDERITSSLLSKLRARHSAWQTGIGFGYDGRSMLMTSHSLQLPILNDNNEPFLSEMIGLPSRATGEESTRKRYRVTITEVCRIVVPAAGSTAWTDLDQTVLQNLDVNLVSFIRTLQNSDSPAWSLIGPKIFATAGPSTPLVGAFVAKCGYYSTLKSCLAGLVLNVDLSVNVFVDAGPVMAIMHHASKYQSFNDFNAKCAETLPPGVLHDILEALKNVKIRTMHTGFDKKVVGIGPAADSPESAFDHQGRRVTVAQYFELMCSDTTKPMYRQALPKRKLVYPKLPTINIGSNSRPILVPAELCNVITPQVRNNVMTPEITGKIITVAAMRPNDRMHRIVHGQEGSESIVSILSQDANNRAIGLGNISSEPMAVTASLLPPAKIQYQGQGPQSIVFTELRGDWKMEGKKFYSPPPGVDASRKYKYGVLMISSGPPPQTELELKQVITTFQRDLEERGITLGLPLLAVGPLLKSSDREERIREELTKLHKAGAKIVVCVMLMDGFYGTIKKVSDPMGLVTQCIRWKVIKMKPFGLFTNLLLKMQTKLGGTNHVLTSRTQASSRQQFQEPPSSIAWVMEKPCMLLGIDVSHPDPGSDKPSMAAIVASMDGKLSQYCAILSAQTSRQEMVSGLEDAVVKLLETFRARNRNIFPETIVVYRDGVSEGQYDQVLQQELPGIHGALERCGFIPNGQVKVTIVVCQKRHHTRLVYEERSGRDTIYINPCPGLVVDARRNGSIVSGALNEFYLNSHTAIQGTSKPCKYTVIYDEIGFRVSELELLTYWTTFLYARCNRSVSYATPAYYAHWASQRAKNLGAAGASPELLQQISDVWSSSLQISMFFI